MTPHGWELELCTQIVDCYRRCYGVIRRYGVSNEQMVVRLTKQIGSGQSGKFFIRLDIGCPEERGPGQNQLDFPLLVSKCLRSGHMCFAV